MRGMKCMAVVMLILYLCLFPTGAMALTSSEKEETYSAAILELESYLEKSHNSSSELAGIALTFDSLEGYEQSKYLGYYVKVLQKIADETYDQALLLYLDMLSNPVFSEYLSNNLKGSAIRPVDELRVYAQAREYERNGKIDDALESYRACFGAFDATDRYYALQNGLLQQRYEEAWQLFNNEDYAGAYFTFQGLSKYKDSKEIMESIVNLLGYTPSSRADNLLPVNSINVVSVENNSITVEWPSSTHAKEYEVYYQLANTDNWILAATTSLTSYTIKDLQQDKSYIIKIFAKSGSVKSVGKSIPSKTSSLKVTINSVQWATVKNHYIQSFFEFGNLNASMIEKNCFNSPFYEKNAPAYCISVKFKISGIKTRKELPLYAVLILPNGETFRSKSTAFIYEDKEENWLTLFDEDWNTIYKSYDGIPTGKYTFVFGIDKDIHAEEYYFDILSAPEQLPSGSNYDVGETIFWGQFEQDNNITNGEEKIEWIIIKKEKDRVLLLSKYGLFADAYTDWNTAVTWESSPLRVRLNKDFLSRAFSDSEQARIISVTNDNSREQCNPEWDTDGGNNTTDYIFFLSYAEYNKYVRDKNYKTVSPTVYARANGAWIAESNGNGQWFLRSPGDIQSNVAHVDQFGNTGSSCGGGWDCIRPAMWLDISE